MIELCSATFQYPGAPPIFEGFDWRVENGEAWAVLGPSGCGKSTLLYLLAGLRFPQTGEILVGEEVISKPRPKTGLILQDYGLLPWATVLENASLGLRIRQFYGPDGKHSPLDELPQDILERAEHWLKRLRLYRLRDQYPGQISGGQRQRTAIARTLVLNPDLLLMDEPFASLDAPTRESLQRLVFELRGEQKLTTIIVTHSIEEAAILGEKILVLDNPPNLSPRIVDNPKAGAEGFIGSPDYNKICSQLRSMLEVSDERA